jgi:integrase
MGLAREIRRTQLFPAVNTFKLLARADDEAKIGFKVHPHMLRHACGQASVRIEHSSAR